MRRIIATIALSFVLVAVAACSSGGGLTGKTWQWTASTTVNPVSQSVVPNPENYTLAFATDGTFSAKADCNQVAGSYTTSGSDITITPGPSTLAFCGEGSMGDLYVAGLGQAKTYAVANSELTLTLADGGTMTFK